MEFNQLIPLGAKIKVDKSKIESLISQKFLDALPQIINGEVIDYKMTDGMGIGYVILTENNQRIWIFNGELNEQTKREFTIDDINKSQYQKSNDLIVGRRIFDYDINGNKNIKTILNPINLFSWLIFTLKDIF